MWRNVKAAWLLPISALVAGCASSPAGAKSPAVPSQQSAVYQSLAVSSQLSPSSRESEAMAYFPPGNELVLFGGADYVIGHVFGDTWAFDRHGWRQLHPATSPPARAESAIAYDPELRELILYGGCGLCGGAGYRLLQDTWAFNGTTWHALTSQRTPTYEPSPLLAWDTATGALELLAPPPGFGASPPNGDFSSQGADLERWSLQRSGWTWDGIATGLPLFVQSASFVPEPGSKTMLFFSWQPYSGSCYLGGCGADPTGLLYSQTWTCTGSACVRAAPERAPKSSGVMADLRIGRVVAVSLSRIWWWTGTTWEEQGTNAPVSMNGAMAYDSDLGDVVVFGVATSRTQPNSTWVWDGSSWAVAVP
jgi:hypothetical protein